MENLVKILSKASERMKTFGVSSADLDNISTKFKINWYTLASQEDDDSIQEFWAKLLVQECLENSSVSLRTLDLLHKLTSTEAIILDNYFSEILFYEDNGRGDEKYIFPQVVSLFGQDDEYYPDISRFNWNTASENFQENFEHLSDIGIFRLFDLDMVQYAYFRRPKFEKGLKQSEFSDKKYYEEEDLFRFDPVYEKGKKLWPKDPISAYKLTQEGKELYFALQPSFEGRIWKWFLKRLVKDYPEIKVTGRAKWAEQIVWKE